MGVTTYRITPTLPREFMKYLPSKEDIEKRINEL
jgi:hypothetical protein